MRYVLSTVFSLSALGKYGLHRHPSRIGGHGLPTAGSEHCTMRLVHYLVGLRWVGMVHIGHVFPSHTGGHGLPIAATL